MIVIQGYGATECGPAAATTEQDHPTGTVGRPCHRCRSSSTGSNEILVSGPTVFDGYWKDPDATAAVMRDGWYRMARYNAARTQFGVFYYDYRIDDLIERYSTQTDISFSSGTAAKATSKASKSRRAPISAEAIRSSSARRSDEGNFETMGRTWTTSHPMPS